MLKFRRALLIAVAIVSVLLLASCGRRNANQYTYREVEGGYEITGIKESREELKIPSKYNKKSVVGIGDRAFFGAEEIKSVKLPEGLEYIGVKAFKNCYNLEAINMPSTLTEIKEDALYNCDKLIYEEYLGCYYIDNWLMEISDRTMKVVNVREGTVGICSFACYQAVQVRKVNFCDSLKHIGSHAFFDIPFLREVEIGSNVETIGQYAFANCELLKTITIPSNVKRIDNDVFHNCKCTITVEGSKSADRFGNNWSGECEVKYE